MSCVIRLVGKNLDVDKLMAKSKLKPAAVFRKGEPKIKTNPKSKKNEVSGIAIDVSDAGFDDLDAQVQDAIKFLGKNKNEIKKFVRLAGAAGKPQLDFAIERRNVLFQTDYLAPQLLMLAGNLGLGICLSQYPQGETGEE
jgi:hypothetical protein